MVRRDLIQSNYFEDLVGNKRQYNTTTLQQFGAVITWSLNTTGDFFPPVLVGEVINPIQFSQYTTTFNVTLRATDDASGIGRATVAIGCQNNFNTYGIFKMINFCLLCIRCTACIRFTNDYHID